MADYESTMKWHVDITQFISAMNEAKRSIKMADAEFKESTASMNNWSKSTEGVSAKLNQLKSMLSGQQRVLDILNQKYQDMTEEQRTNTAAGQKLAIEIKNQEAAVKSTQARIAYYNQELNTLEKEQKESQTATAQLTKSIKDQETQLNGLKKTYADAVLQYGKNSKEAQSLATQIEKLSGELVENKQKMTDAEKSANELDKSLDKADDSAREAANGGFTVLKGAMANLVSQGISKAIEGLKQLAGKVIEVGKQSIGSYANYEQLVGGVETLFKDSADIVQEYADNAFKTAGMSANDYMETVTSFSASLLQGLKGDTAKAAKIADQAIVDMSDNANKMGTDISSIQNAYQGFAKGNFTMLDNLKLGYGGTKTEMLRLVKDAGVVKQSVKSMDEVSFDQIIEAIHIVQTEIGITGTTSKEAADTIEGSQKAMSASWSNLLTEMAKSDGDIGAAFDTFVNSAMTYFSNLLPRIKELMSNVVGYIREKLQEVAPEFLATIDEVINTVKQIVAFLTPIVKFIIDNADAIAIAIGGIVTALGVLKLSTMTIEGMKKALMGLEIVQKAVTAAQWLMNVAMNANPIGIIIAAVVALVAAFAILWKKSEGFRNFWIGLWEGIKNVAKTVVEAIGNFFSGLWDSIKNIWTKAGEFFAGVWNGIKEVFAPVINFFKTLFDNAWIAVKNIWIVAKAFFTAIWNGIKAVFTPVINFFKDIFSRAWESIKAIWNTVSTFFSGIWTKIKNVFTPVVQWFKNIFSNAWQAIKNVFNTVGSFFGGIWETIKEKFTNIGQKVGDAIGGVFKTAINAVLATAENVLNAPIRAINSLINKIRKVPGLGGLSTLNEFSLPRLAQGGVLKKGQVGLLEGSGAEAVVPLEKNKQWIARVVKEVVDQLDVNGVKGAISGGIAGMNAAKNTVIQRTQNLTFNQYNTSPKALDRLSIYRDTNNMLFTAKVRLGNV